MPVTPSTCLKRFMLISCPSRFDLPPSQVARPLPVNRSNKHNDIGKSQSEGVAKKRKAKGNADDAPRAFKRLMAFANGKKPKSGLDDGAKKPKRNTADTTSSVAPSTDEPTGEAASRMPTIRPGEKLSDFAARVDQALPLSGLVTKTVKDGKDVTGLKVKRTLKERKMHKLYDQWREEDRKIKEKREEAQEEAMERQIDEDLANGTWRDWTKDYSKDVAGTSAKTRKDRRGKKKTKQKEEDPWKEFERKHAEPRRGLHDVAQAPPELRGPGTKVKVREI